LVIQVVQRDEEVSGNRGWRAHEGFQGNLLKRLYHHM